MKIWNVSGHTCIKKLREHDGEVWSVSLPPDGTLVASGGQNLTVRLWDVKIGNCRWIANEYQDIAWKTAMTADGKILVSASYDETIKYWDIDAPLKGLGE